MVFIRSAYKLIWFRPVTDVFHWVNEVFVGFVFDPGLMSNMSTSEFAL